MFLCFGLSGPRNAVSGAIIVLGAISIASAMVVIMEFDTPLAGLFKVPSRPMWEALQHLGG